MWLGRKGSQCNREKIPTQSPEIKEFVQWQQMRPNCSVALFAVKSGLPESGPTRLQGEQAISSTADGRQRVWCMSSLEKPVAVSLPAFPACYERALQQQHGGGQGKPEENQGRSLPLTEGTGLKRPPTDVETRSSFLKELVLPSLQPRQHRFGAAGSAQVRRGGSEGRGGTDSGRASNLSGVRACLRRARGGSWPLGELSFLLLSSGMLHLIYILALFSFSAIQALFSMAVCFQNILEERHYFYPWASSV